MPPRRLRFTTTELSTVSTQGWGVISGPSEQPETPPAREPEPPGEFVSEDLRADCARFLEDQRALIRWRADLPPGSERWLPGCGE